MRRVHEDRLPEEPGKVYWPDLGLGRATDPNAREIGRGASETGGGCRQRCQLFRGALSPYMEPYGKGQRGVLIVGEAPGAEEDRQGRPFVGPSGEELAKGVDWAGYDLDRDCVRTNACRCRPPKNATPTATQLNACRWRLLEHVEEMKPRVIILLGRPAVDGLLGHRLTERMGGLTMTDWVGVQIPDQLLKAWICPLYHPAYLMRNKDDPSIRRVWREQLKIALDLCDKPVPQEDYRKQVVVVKAEEGAIAILDQLRRKGKPVAFDYETTGLKPHRAGHRIVSASVSDGELAWSFPFFLNLEFRSAWRRLMLSRRTGKIAHLARFEAMWTFVRGAAEGDSRYWPEGWAWDTNLASHCLHNNKTTRLKFWAYVLFGALGWDTEVEPYLTQSKRGEDGKSSNAFNRIDDAPLDSLLLYGGLDSLFEYKLYAHQRTLLRGARMEGYKFFMEGQGVLGRMQERALRMDVVALDRAVEETQTALWDAEKELNERPELEDYKGAFQFNSSRQVEYLLYGELELETDEQTDGGKPSTDERTLTRLKHPVAEAILKCRKLHKLVNTYLQAFNRERVGRWIRPAYDLSTVSSFRSSCYDPNFQNNPKRHEDSARTIRELFRPRPGNRLIEWDYKGVEVCFDGQTGVETIEGSKPIKEIVEQLGYHPTWVYCYDYDKGRIGVSRVVDGFLVQRNAEVIEVELDNGSVVKATPDHKFMLRDGSYRSVCELKSGDSLMPFYSRIKKEGKVNYLDINLNNGRRMRAHNLISEDVFGVVIGKSSNVVHHKDGNGMNNSLTNLEVVDRREHMRIHAIQGWKRHPVGNRKGKTPEQLEKQRAGLRKWWKSLSEGERADYVRRIGNHRPRSGSLNGMFGKRHSSETIKKISQAKKGKPLSEECRKRLVDNGARYWENVRKGLVTRILSDDTHRRMSESQKKKRLSSETKEKIRLKLKGRVFSTEHRRNLNESSKRRWEKIRKERNHRVIAIRQKGECVDVYCITVERTHNFALSAGAVVKNCVSACINRDPALLAYVKDKTRDMHRDQALLLFERSQEEYNALPKDLAKQERYLAKNGFVFAEFYGDYWKKITPNIWYRLPEATAEHLRDRGYKTLKQYANHVREVENDFWGRRFPVYNEWKEQSWTDYKRRGYVDLVTGFRCYGPLSRNQVTNLPIQGPAFHCLLWTLIQVEREMAVHVPERTMLVGQIHDAALGDVHPDDEALMDSIMRKWGTEMIREQWAWLIVPLVMEKSRSEVNGNWMDLTDMGPV